LRSGGDHLAAGTDSGAGFGASFFGASFFFSYFGFSTFLESVFFASPPFLGASFLASAATGFLGAFSITISKFGMICFKQ